MSRLSNSFGEVDNILLLVAQVATSYFSANQVPHGEIEDVIARIAAGLQSVAQIANRDLDSASPPRRATAAEIRRSISPEGLISFEDGRAYRLLGRHLSARGLTPDQYREKWGLPRDYPMAAANYSAVRSELAKRMQLSRLGHKARKRRRGRGVSA